MEKISGSSSSFIKGVFTLAKGTLLARVIGLACIPILTRLYAAEDYGLVALYAAFVVTLSPLLSFRYVQAIPLVKLDKLAGNVFYLSLTLCIFNSIILSLLFLFWGQTLFSLIELSTLYSWWPMIIVGSLGTSLYEALSMWAIRKKNYKELAISQVHQSLGGNATKVLAGVLTANSLGLVLGQVISQCGGALNFIRLYYKELKKLLVGVSVSKLVFLAGYFRDFLYFRTPAQLLMNLSLQAPILMIATLFNEEKTGQFSLAIMTLSLPVSMIGSAVAKAYYSEIAALGKSNHNEIYSLSMFLQKKLFLIGLPISLLVYFTAEALFVVIFGKEWQSAGVYASILAPYILFQFTSGPLMEVFNVLGRQKYYLYIHSLRLIGLLLVYIAAGKLNLNDVNFVSFLSGYLTLFYVGVTLFVNLSLKRGVRCS